MLIKALRTAHAMLGRDAAGGPVIDAIPASPYHRKLLRLAFLAPDLQRAILAGRQPPGLSLKQLLDQRLAAALGRAGSGFRASGAPLNDLIAVKSRSQTTPVPRF